MFNVSLRKELIVQNISVYILFFIVSDDIAKHEGSMWEKENDNIQSLPTKANMFAWCHCCNIALLSLLPQV